MITSPLEAPVDKLRAEALETFCSLSIPSFCAVLPSGKQHQLPATIAMHIPMAQPLQT